jgi:hypothetical protein
MRTQTAILKSGPFSSLQSGLECFEGIAYFLNLFLPQLVAFGRSVEHALSS